jgi:hypothetical protein
MRRIIQILAAAALMAAIMVVRIVVLPTTIL